MAFVVSAEVTVSNLSVAQRPGTKLVDISYDVASTETNVVTVSLVVSNGAAAVTDTSLTGHVGPGVPTGTGKTMVWNGGADAGVLLSASMGFAVTADDGVSSGTVPECMVLIPAGTVLRDADFGGGELNNPTEFYMDVTEVTKAQWDEVAGWAEDNGYDITPGGGSGKASNHPVHYVTWYECVKWCNARSQKEGKTPCYTVSGSVYKTGESSPTTDFSVNGYRLPSSTEWEYAARGGVSGKRFPWGDTITHSQANYYSSTSYSYDTSPTRGFHPDYDDGGYPYTSPVGSFVANGYGLVDMEGNVWEWCDTTSGSYRILRGGGWYYRACYARCGSANSGLPYCSDYYGGFRSVCR